MPNRIIKESICTSETLASISPEAERLWWRLIVQADDYGRYDGRPKTILGKCLTSLIGKVSEAQVERWLSELERAGLIRRYRVDGRPYLEIATWGEHQRPPRAKKPKFPPPQGDDCTCGHMTSDDSTCEQMAANAPDIRESGIENRESGIEKRKGESTPPDGGATPLTPERVAALWNEVCGDVLPRVTKLTDTRRRHVKARLAADRSRDEAWWRSYFSRIRASPFCCGDNPRGWRADFDFAVRSEDVVARVLEGRYESRKPAKDHGVSDWTGQRSGVVDMRAILRQRGGAL